MPDWSDTDEIFRDRGKIRSLCFLCCCRRQVLDFPLFVTTRVLPSFRLSNLAYRNECDVTFIYCRCAAKALPGNDRVIHLGNNRPVTI